VQPDRGDQGAGSIRLAVLERGGLVGLGAGEVVDPGGAEEAVELQVAARRLAAEGREEVAIEAPGHDRPRPGLLDRPRICEDSLGDQLVRAAIVVDRVELGSRVAQHAGRRLAPVESGHFRLREPRARPSPGRRQARVVRVARLEPGAEMARHRRARVRLVTQEAPVVPLAVDPPGDLDARQGAALLGRGQGAQQLLQPSRRLRPPFPRGQAHAAHRIIVLFDDPGEAVGRLVHVAGVRVAHPLLRMRPRPPARRGEV